MERLNKLIGREVGIKKVSRVLHEIARDLHAPVVGAVHVTCADESERECIQAFDRCFTELLPDLKFGQKSHFRIANLGARYEWGVVRIAEEHFALPDSQRDFKLMVVKLNSHVSAKRSLDGRIYGTLERYGQDSTCCGALAGLLKGATGQPFLDDLHETFNSEGKDRISMLRDEKLVPPVTRLLLAALVNARLQARRALVEIQDHRPETPTLYLVLPCVTVNLKEEDTEILCGVYRADCRKEQPEVEYRGLSADPSKYKLGTYEGTLQIEDDQFDQPRSAREHRQLVRNEWENRNKDRSPKNLTDAARGTEFEKILEKIRAGKKQLGEPKALLKTFMRALMHLSPVTSAISLFAEGVAGIHHVHQAHRLARELAGDSEARRILEEIRSKVDTLPPERAKAVMDVLISSHQI
jgi:hypothetical protein